MKNKKVGIRKVNPFKSVSKNKGTSLKEIVVKYLTNDYRSTKLGYCFSCAVIAIGALLASFAVACILLPNDAIDYGTAGIAIVVSKLTGFNLSLCVVLIFIPFLIGGYIHMGKKFSVKALVGTIAYTIGLEVFNKISFELDTEHYLAAVFGGSLLGLGLSIVLRFGGCIDGSEILANIITNKLAEKTGRDYSMGSILIIFNVFVYSLVFILIEKNTALMSLLVYFVATMIIDHFTDRFESIKQVTIITNDPDELILDIKNKLKKTCTIICSRGAIAGENYTLICYVSYFELQGLMDIISKADGTFCTISTVDEIVK